MDDKELMDFVKWLPDNSELFKNLNTEETIAKINNLSSSEEGKEILKQLTNIFKNKEMKLFKDGGKINYLLCLKKGGKSPDCGCNKSIEKNQDGGDISRRYAFDVAEATGMDNSDIRKMYRSEKQKLRDAGLKGKNLRQSARSNVINNALNSILPVIENSLQITEERLPLEYGFDPFERKLNMSLVDTPMPVFEKKNVKIDDYTKAKSFYSNWDKWEIEKLQRFLSTQKSSNGEEYYNLGEVDGIIGPKTIEAVKKYQKDRGLKNVDGMWGFETDRLHQVMNNDALNKGRYSANYKGHDNGDFTAYDPTFGATIHNVDKKDVAKAIEYYAINPELFFSNDAEHSKWRQIFQNSGKDGQDFINMLYGSLGENDQKRVAHSNMATPQIRKQVYDKSVSDQKDAFWNATGKIAPMVFSPILLGSGVPALVSGGAPATAYLSGLGGATLGGTILSEVGNNIGYNMAKDELLTKLPIGVDEEGKTLYGTIMENDTNRSNFGVAGGIGYTPETVHLSNTAKDYTDIGRNVGGLAGSLAGGAVGTAFGTIGSAGLMNHLGKGAAVRNYQDPYVITHNTSMYGGSGSKPVDFSTWLKQFKAGFSKAPTYKGTQKRFGGPHGFKFAKNPSSWKVDSKANPGVFASPKQIAHATEMYTSPGSLINPRFGGQINLGTSAKIGNTYTVNWPRLLEFYGNTNLPAVPIIKSIDE